MCAIQIFKLIKNGLSYFVKCKYDLYIHLFLTRKLSILSVIGSHGGGDINTDFFKMISLHCYFLIIFIHISFSK